MFISKALGAFGEDFILFHTFQPCADVKAIKSEGAVWQRQFPWDVDVVVFPPPEIPIIDIPVSGRAIRRARAIYLTN